MYICIEGNIGVGKTTLAKALSKKMGVQFLAERFEDNTLLPLFYKDPKTYAFPTEYSFLIDRQKQLVNYFSQDKLPATVIADFHFDKCICFAKANLSAKDYLFYKKHFKAIQKTVAPPDLIIYLTSSPGQLMKNIEKRGRAIEKDVKQNYLERLKKSFDNYYSGKHKLNTFVKVITIEEYNNDTTAYCYGEIIKTIKTLKLK